MKSLSTFFTGFDNSSKMDLRIEKRVTKGEVMEKKREIVDDIAELFNNLMPLYGAAVTLKT